MIWLTETPSAVVRACVVMLPRLTAEESLQAVHRAAISFGSVTDGNRIMADWAQLARGTEQKAPPLPHEVRARMGIGYRVKKKKAATDGH